MLVALVLGNQIGQLNVNVGRISILYVRSNVSISCPKSVTASAMIGTRPELLLTWDVFWFPKLIFG
jgi:hypothetical protein